MPVEFLGIAATNDGSETTALGIDIISMRGYNLLQDAIDVGQQVIPLVREEVAKRDAVLAP
jgi:hypothetical protein